MTVSEARTRIDIMGIESALEIFVRQTANDLAPDDRTDIKAADVKVTDATTFAAAGVALNSMKRRAADLEAHRKSLTKPLLDAKRAIDVLFAPAIEDRARYETILKDRMAKWQAADRANRAEQERIAREQQAAEAARLREEQAKAEAEGNLEAAVELNFAAELASAPVAAPQAVKVAGISTRTAWDFEVTDFDLLIVAAANNPAAFRQYLMPNEKAIRAAVKAQHEAFKVPGITTKSSDAIAGSRR